MLANVNFNLEKCCSSTTALTPRLEQNGGAHNGYIVFWCVRVEEGSADCLRMLEQIEAKLDSHLAALAKYEGNRTSVALQCHAYRNCVDGEMSTAARKCSAHFGITAAEDPELVHQLERVKEKQRRERTRQEKLSQQHHKSDERLQARCDKVHL